MLRVFNWVLRLTRLEEYSYLLEYSRVLLVLARITNTNNDGYSKASSFSCGIYSQRISPSLSLLHITQATIDTTRFKLQKSPLSNPTNSREVLDMKKSWIKSCYRNDIIVRTIDFARLPCRLLKCKQEKNSTVSIAWFFCIKFPIKPSQAPLSLHLNLYICLWNGHIKRRFWFV